MASELKIVDLPERRPGERCCGPEMEPRLRGPAAERLAEDVSILGHPVRLQILELLARNQGGVCVCDLETALPVKQPTVSHHLRLLREAGLIAGERRGLWVYYRLCPEALARVGSRLAELLRLLGVSP